MVRRQDNQQRENQQRRNNNNQGGSLSQSPRNFQEQDNRKDGNPPRNNYRDRDNSYKQNYGGQYQTSNNTAPAANNSGNTSYASRYSNRVKSVETIDDIKADICRLEKEIELEIKEIMTLRLGL